MGNVLLQHPKLMYLLFIDCSSVNLDKAQSDILKAQKNSEDNKK